MITRSKQSVSIPQVPLHEAIFSNLNQHGDKVALVNGVSGASHTHHQMAAAMRTLGSAFSRLGIKKGDVLMFYAPNSIEYCLATLGCFSIGAIFSGVNYTYKEDELAHQMTDCKPKIMVTISANVPMVNKVLSEKNLEVKHIVVLDTPFPDTTSFDDLQKDDGSAYPEDVTFDVFDDVAAIMYSSGTTGLPKGVMLTHFNLVANLIMILHPELLLPVEQGCQRCVLLFLPMFHMFGMITYLSMLCSGDKSVVLPAFKPDVFLKAIQDYKVTNLFLVPPIILFMAKSPLIEQYDLSSVRAVGCGAAPLTKDTEETFLARFKLDKLTQGYGMTEMTACVAADGYDMHKKPGASGCLAANTIAKIVDIETGTDLDVGEEGEICVQGPQMMKGYLNRPVATSAIIDEDNWLHTGDVGHFDADGDLFVTGRIKELIKHKGFQVAPAEVEGVIMRLPGVNDAAVIGVPDEAAGELPRAFVVKRPDSDITDEQICNFVKERLSRHKWLSGGVVFVESIPKTASGKILRKEVKKMLKI